MSRLEAEVLVVGSGMAGLSFALKVAPFAHVLLLTKKERAASNTNYARGGIAAVMGENDDPELHVRDTLEAGAGLCHREAVEILVREGPERVRELMEWGARFARGEGERLSLGREGGHSRRRIVHAADRTGREVERALLQSVADEPRIEVLEDFLVVDLLVEGEGRDGRRCAGAVVLDHVRGELREVRADVTYLATGGCGQVYRHTTNPAIATGDGVAMAYRARARVANMEFIQFHPTALYPTEDPAFLISEAIRGEGAVLRRLDGTTFMEGYHPRGSLAPRDVVARAIDRELKLTGAPHVILDISPIPADEMERRFPGAVEGCRERGIDLFRDGIPVVPAAHYVCGGILTDDEGRSSLPGLFAAGEVACTGVHGANRLASNSLLEAVVFGHRAARAVVEQVEAGRGRSGASGASLGTIGPAGAGPPPEAVLVSHDRGEVRRLMWDLVGIVRSDERLAIAEERVRQMLDEHEALWQRGPWTPERVELRNLLQVAHLIVRSAVGRRESRGLHYNQDHPEPDEACRHDTVLAREPRDPATHGGSS